MADKLINGKSMLKLSLAVEYNNGLGHHRDMLHVEKLNVWRDADLLPAQIHQTLMGKQPGHKETFSFSTGELIEPYTQALLHRIRLVDFNRKPRKYLTVAPHTGRFYPKGWFAGIEGNYSENMTPARIVHMDNEFIQVDFNHPLSAYDLQIELEVLHVDETTDEHGGRCNDCLADLLHGPGMQLRYQDTPTDFFTDKVFGRADEAVDSVFYTMPRMVNHLDETALQQVKSLHSELIPRHARILDLMSSVNSHLADDIHADTVTGLGLNKQELAANPSLDERLIHDLNRQPVLPFEDHSYDAVLCTVSVEYLIRPIEVFQEVARVLKPNGVFITTFSNRWFPTKAIELWTNLHEFERMGLVREYFLRAGGFAPIHTHSVRGLPRPEDDRHALPLSDPIYAVWGYKT